VSERPFLELPLPPPRPPFDWEHTKVDKEGQPQEEEKKEERAIIIQL